MVIGSIKVKPEQGHIIGNLKKVTVSHNKLTILHHHMEHIMIIGVISDIHSIAVRYLNCE